VPPPGAAAAGVQAAPLQHALAFSRPAPQVHPWVWLACSFPLVIARTISALRSRVPATAVSNEPLKPFWPHHQHPELNDLCAPFVGPHLPARARQVGALCRGCSLSVIK
jgi:hypothetical protein